MNPFRHREWNVPLRKLIGFFLVIVLSSLACNAPWIAPQSSSVMTVDQLRQTVEAMPTFTPRILETPPIQPENNPLFQAPTSYPPLDGSDILYQSQPGDTLEGILGRFEVEPMEIKTDGWIPDDVFLQSGTQMRIPDHLQEVSPSRWLIPDSEVVNSARDFHVGTYVKDIGGYLHDHREMVDEELILSGSEIIERVSDELSVNPRLLLALLDYRSGWVTGRPAGASQDRFPLGLRIPGREGLYEEAKIAATQLNRAYYGWREGTFTSIRFEDGTVLRLDPRLNAGTVAVMHLFSILSEPKVWRDDLYAPNGFPALLKNLHGDPWDHDAELGPLFPDGIQQPSLELPFRSGENWSLTAGPHRAWNAGTPLGAMDFSPIELGEPCDESTSWVTASAPGLIVRARHNTVALDVDGDGEEGSGWVVIYYHIAEKNMVVEGSYVEADQRIGHPSCEGGQATGNHVHLARKFNGEWLAADGPVPLVLSGWQAEAGEMIYKGRLVKGSSVVTADPSGRSGSTITR